MPGPRESSVTTNRRATARQHHPFPMDGLLQGRRTGLKAKPARRNSDGVEDFGNFLSQLDNQNARPARAPHRRPSVLEVHIPLFDRSRREEDEDDDYEVEDDITPPPTSGFTRQPLQPSSIQRNYRSARTPPDEYDELPAPPPVSRKRKSEIARRSPPRVVPEPDYEEYEASVPSSGGRRKSATARRGTPSAKRGRRDSEDEGDADSPGVARRQSSNFHLSARMPRDSTASRKSRTSVGYEQDDFPASIASRRSVRSAATDMDVDEGDADEAPHSSFADLAQGDDDDFGGQADDIPFADEELEPEPPSACTSRRKSKGRALTPIEDDIEVPFVGDEEEPQEEEPEEEEPEEDEEPVRTPSVVSSRVKGKQRAVTPVHDDEDDDLPVLSVHKDRKQRTATPAKRASVAAAEEDEEGTPTPISRRDKGKARATEPEPEDDFPPPLDMDEPAEPLFNPGTSDEELPPAPDLEEEEPEPELEPEPTSVKGKKGRKKRNSDEVMNGNVQAPAKKPRKKKQPAASSSQRAWREGTVEINRDDLDDEEDSVDEDGRRRGRRTRYRPLEWWRLERVEYGRGKELAEIKKIITLPKAPPKSLGGAKRRGGSRKPPSGRGRSRTAGPAEDVDPDVLEQARMERWNPEDGWDKDTKADCAVVDTAASGDVIRRIAFTEAMLALKSAENDSFAFQKVFNDGEFLAAGILEIPAGGAKPSRSTRDNTYVFYVAEGAVGVTVHKTNFYLCQGGMLMVPSDNYFSIDNPSDRDARLFFCQARKGVGGAKPTYSRPPRASVGASSDAESYRRASTSVRP